ncbi:MAG: hypothetical protein HYR56_13610 [Acidobacteria bacterium]|nr:hypothetical protein [Acidobacteriota bacterium]MBI3425217.1 hypothetical protein [Acidobacteriota bacterium]
MKNRIAFGIALLAVLALSVAALRAQNAKPAAKAKSTRVDISKDKAGGESARFLSVVGNWAVVEDGGKKVWLMCSQFASPGVSLGND